MFDVEWSFTNSELETLRRCKRKWYLGYVRALEPARDRIIPPRLRGNIVHQSLQLYYELGENPLVFIQSEMTRVLAEYEASVEFPDTEVQRDIEKTFDLALAMIEGYLVWVSEEGVDADLEFQGAEVELSYPLGERHKDLPNISILGKIDERFQRQSDGFVAFMDHKTVGDLVSLPKWAQINTQLLHYHVLVKLTETEDREIDGGIFNMLRTVKRSARSNPPFYDRWTVRHNRIQLNNYYQHMLAEIREALELRLTLDRGTSHHQACPPTPTGDCAWSCSFFSVCPMMDDGSDWEGFLQDAYKSHHPLDRYKSLEKG